MINSNPTCDVSVINTDKNPAYNQAIKELKKEGHLAQHVSHLQINYRNNRLEADHGKLKRLKMKHHRIKFYERKLFKEDWL